MEFLLTGKRLCFDDDGAMKGDKLNMSIMIKWEVHLKRSNWHKVTTPPHGILYTLNMLTHIFRILRLQNPKRNVCKGTRIRKLSHPLLLPKILHIEEMMIFMHKYIEWIIDVEDDDNCSFRVVLSFLGKGEEDH